MRRRRHTRRSVVGVDLVGREHRPPNAHIGQSLKACRVDRRLGQPHAERCPTEPRPELVDAPTHDGRAVTGRGQRKNGVNPRVRHGTAAGRVAHRDRGAEAGVAAVEPHTEGGAEIEAHRLVQVGRRHGGTGLIEPLRLAQREIALGGDALVPVVVRLRRLLALDLTGLRVLARRLIGVAVDAHVRGHGCTPGEGGCVDSTINASGGNVIDIECCQVPVDSETVSYRDGVK